MKEEFRAKEFRSESMGLIEQVNEILEEYAAQGYVLTLRQVYYQLVARGLIPNTLESYSRIGNAVSNGRLAGLIDWSHIEDRARETVTPASWKDPAEILEACSRQYQENPWEDQSYYIEVLVEKQALEGVLLPVTRKYMVPFTACKGYLSQSMVYEIAQRLNQRSQAGKQVLLLYLGDHDPSGLDMDRDITSRLLMFTRGEVSFELVRLALTKSQIEKYEPPENPAKITDSRAKKYIQEHGRSSWELDALEPKVLVQLVRKNIEKRLDFRPWDESKAKEQQGRALLRALAKSLREEGTI